MKNLTKTLTATIHLAVLLAAASSRGDCGRLFATLTNLPPLEGFSYQVYGLNSAGQIAGFISSAAGDVAYAFMYSRTEVQNLDTLGAGFSMAFALNNSGQAVGLALNSNGSSHAALFDGVNMVDLGTLGGSASVATAVNDQGQTAGLSLTAGDAVTEAFLYSNGSMAGLGTLGGSLSSSFALNNAGVVAGISTLEDGNFHGFVSDGTNMTDVGTLGGQYSSAFNLNDSGLVVGESALSGGNIHGFLYQHGQMADIGSLGGDYSSAFAVNGSGQALGLSSTAGELAYHGFLFGGGVMIDLGTLGGSNTFPAALNNLGQIVGQSETGDAHKHAFLWQNGHMVDLNSALPANSGWELQRALFLNDAGRVVGTGTHNGLDEWFILDFSAGNSPPIAVAGPDQTVDCQTQVVLDGSHSSDPDGDALAFEWSQNGSVLGTNAILATYFSTGTNTVTLKVTDGCGASNQLGVVITVVDTIPPVIVSGPALAPISANASCQAAVPSVVSQIVASDNCTPASALVITQEPAAGTPVGLGPHTIIVTATDASGNSTAGFLEFSVVDTTPPVITSWPAPVTVSVGANCQGVVPNILAAVVATDGCTPANQLIMTQSPAAGSLLAKGQYIITVTVKDPAGNAAQRGVPLTLVDTTPPVIRSLAVSPNVLSPPNHQMVAVTVSMGATDNCDVPVNQIVSITANEATSAGDIQITGKLTARLAASRSNGGNGRVYSITVRSTDSSGNSSTGTVTVTVPHDNGHK